MINKLLLRSVNTPIRKIIVCQTSEKSLEIDRTKWYKEWAIRWPPEIAHNPVLSRKQSHR